MAINNRLSILCIYLSVVFEVTTSLKEVPNSQRKSISNIIAAERDKIRIRRQDAEYNLETPEEPPNPCDFGSGTNLHMCQWVLPINITSRVRWVTGQGATSVWIGGPRADHTVSDETGGYAFFETSFDIPENYQSPDTAILTGGFSGRPFTHPHPHLPPALPPGEKKQEQEEEPEFAQLISRNVSKTGAAGMCFSFYYAVEGLSADKLRVTLQDMETLENQTLWEVRNDGSSDVWHKAEIAYSYGYLHWIVFEGFPTSNTDLSRTYRGFIAVDDVIFKKMDAPDRVDCVGQCTFEGGFCEWTNEEDDDFDWNVGRGTQSYLTGPSRDYKSSTKEEQTGGYAYIDANYPRRPGDSARLISPILTSTGDNSPICMHFATHMFGNGIGSLRVRLRVQGSAIKDKIIWEIVGESGNRWYPAQVPVSSPSAFQLIFDALVGPNSLGNIAIDNIFFSPGTCPISPQTAAKNSGDCDFEEDSCGWGNVAAEEAMDDFDWARQYSYNINGPNMDHTKATKEGYYMNLMSNPQLPQRGGTKAWMISPVFPVSQSSRCIAFYYFMYERTIDPAGPSLGSVRLYVKLTSEEGVDVLNPIWKMNNHQAQRWLHARAPIFVGAERKPPPDSYQVVIEGIWGDGRVGYIAIDDISFFDGDCTTQPIKATSMMGECSYERDMCEWTNHTTRDSTPIPANLIRQTHPPNEALTWRLASTVSRPANLQDHTFRAPIGYAFFDIFNQVVAQTPILRSPLFLATLNGIMCITFWFAPFGRGDSTTLTLIRVDAEESEEEQRTILWRLSTRRFDTTRPEWIYGQVSINTATDYRLEFEGEATDGGFALDDLVFYDGLCHIRPATAAVTA